MGRCQLASIIVAEQDVKVAMSDGISPIGEQSPPNVTSLLQPQQGQNEPMTTPPGQRPRTCPQTGKRRRFRFKESHDVAMLEAVVKAGAHIAPHGLAQRLFDEATAQLFNAGTFADVVDGPLPTAKTIWDRFRHLVHVHRTGNLRPTCGRGDIFRERERLLEGVITAIDTNKEEVERGGERRRVTGGKRVLKPRDDRVVRRRLEVTSDDATPDSDADVETQPDFIAEPPMTRRETTDAVAPAACMTEEKWKREMDALRLDLEKRRFEAEEEERKRRFEIEARHAKIEEERTAIEMRRLEMEDQERKSARQERQALTTLLSALAQTLMKK